ncbi:MAG: glycosyltransferase family 39 protein [Steroidobacteraceae bacterium]
MTLLSHPDMRGEQPIWARILLILVGAAALVAGLYGRFKGIGTWPLGVDEFYISRSIDNVLRSGLPAFPCGGYYTRGLIYQYAVAALRMGGWSPEFAGRFVAALSSLAVLPAAYLLGRRVQSPLAGWVAVIILCVSVWEIEMARFARMYAPFQAVFTWYLVAFLRYTIDKHAVALRWMIALSVLGVLTWEGGILLGVANLLAVLLSHENGRLRREEWPRLIMLTLLLALLYLATRDLRGYAEPPLPPAGATEEPTTQSLFGGWLAPLSQHPSWALGLLLPVALCVPALRWIVSFRDRWLTCGGLCLVLLAAAAHAFTVAVAALVLMLLVRLIDRRTLIERPARYFWLALGAFALFWFLGDISAAVVRGAAGGTSAAAEASAILHHLLGFPDVYDQILRPWGRTLPVLSLEIFFAVGYLCWTSIVAERGESGSVAALLSVVLVMGLAVGATPTDRVETRYTFFLYPCLIVLAVHALLALVHRQKRLRSAPILLTAVAPLLCFAGTEDFQPRHIQEIDSGEINFRVGMSAVRVAHYYPRNEMGAAAQYLAAHVRPGDVVITGIPNLDEYYPQIDYFFLDANDNRYETYVCQDGSTDRWTNHRVLYTADALKPIVSSGHRVYASLYGAAEERLRILAPTLGWSVTQVWRGSYGRGDVILIVAQADAAGAR